MRSINGIFGAICVAVLWQSCFTEAAGDVQIFDLGSKLDFFQYSVMMTLVLAGLLAFDLALETFEHRYLHHSKRFHRKLFEKTVKQLMILGVVSFVMFILQDQGVVDSSDYELSNTFDFVNLFLFFVGVSFVVAAFVLAMFTVPLKERWDAHTMVPLEDLLASHACIVSKSWTWYGTWPPRFFYVLRQAQVIEYHLFRSVFLRLNRKLLTPAFDFSKYASAIVDEIIIKNFDVGWQSWLLTIIILFLTLPITENDDGSVQVTAYGAFVFGFCVLLLEVVTMLYIAIAYRRVKERFGVENGFKGVGKVLERFWVAPQHHMGQETSAIDVKGLLAAAPVKAPTLSQLTTVAAHSSQGLSSAQANFHTKSNRGSLRGSMRTVESEDSASPPAEPTQGTGADGSVNPSPEVGADGSGDEESDPMGLPPGAVQTCDMNGDPFVLRRIRPPQWVVDRLPKRYKDVHMKVGSCTWFRSLFGMTILLKCYYMAFYFAYGIGRATESSALSAVVWIVLTPIPLLLCLLPLSKKTIPVYAQLACLQGQIVWEVVSEIEEEQGMAERAREKVVEKLQEALRHRTAQLDASIQYNREKTGQDSGLSPRSKAVQDWFDEWDTDDSGGISSQELAEGLQKNGVFLSDAELRELFRLADPDHSKSIEIDEFRHFLAELQSLETDPDHFRRELELRRLRSECLQLEHRQNRVTEEGLITSSSKASDTSRHAAASSAIELSGRSHLRVDHEHVPESDVEMGGHDVSGRGRVLPRHMGASLSTMVEED